MAHEIEGARVVLVDDRAGQEQTFSARNTRRAIIQRQESRTPVHSRNRAHVITGIRLAMSDSPRQPVNRDAWWTRDHVLVIVLFVATGILVVLCWKLVQPFVTPLAWALALAVVAHPVNGWLARRIKNLDSMLALPRSPSRLS